MERKRVLELTDFEHRLMVGGLTDFRNRLIQEKGPTEDINELLLKVIDAPQRRRGGKGVHEER